jgi:AraC-like DNA-binding protein
LPLDSVMLRAQRWLAENLCEPDPINRCAEHLHLSRRTLNRRFREATGATPKEFLQQARLRASVNRLMFSTSSVEEIGYRVGYENVGTFYRLFRRSLGIPPNRYRRQFALQPTGPTAAEAACGHRGRRSSSHRPAGEPFAVDDPAERTSRASGDRTAKPNAL